jgi:hypothetical protein
MTLLLLACVILLLSACAASPAAKKIRIADENMVTNCSFLGEVHAWSGHGGFCASIGVESAKNQA